jgi:hypothetical protein
MKLVGLFSTAALSLVLGAAAPTYAQQEQHDQQEENKEKPAQQEEKKAQEGKKTKQEESTKQEGKTSSQQEKAKRQEDRNARRPQQQSPQAKPEKQAERTGRNGVGRIPDDRFRANFGQEHKFRVSENDYRRDRRFQYGGYWFGFVDPWPDNWLYTQDVFIVEIDGVYYLCNANYPGVNITLSVTL